MASEEFYHVSGFIWDLFFIPKLSATLRAWIHSDTSGGVLECVLMFTTPMSSSSASSSASSPSAQGLKRVQDGDGALRLEHQKNEAEWG